MCWLSRHVWLWTFTWTLTPFLFLIRSVNFIFTHLWKCCMSEWECDSNLFRFYDDLADEHSFINMYLFSDICMIYIYLWYNCSDTTYLVRTCLVLYMYTLCECNWLLVMLSLDVFFFTCIWNIDSIFLRHNMNDNLLEFIFWLIESFIYYYWSTKSK